MSIFVQKFACYETQPLSVSATSAGGSFSTASGQTATQCNAVNYGSKGCWLIFGPTAPTAVVLASAGGTKQYYLPANSMRIVNKGTSKFFAAICDSTDTTTITLEAGEGS